MCLIDYVLRSDGSVTIYTLFTIDYLDADNNHKKVSEYLTLEINYIDLQFLATLV